MKTPGICPSTLAKVRAAEYVGQQVIAKAKAKYEFDAAVAAAIAANPGLVENPKDDRNIAAQNLRRALKLAFPGVKFRARQSRGSMCSAVDVHMPFEASAEQVEAAQALCNQFRTGHFDGQDDSYHYEKNAFVEAFGGFRYVFVEKEWRAAA